MTIRGFFGSFMVRDVRSHPVIPSLGTAVAQLRSVEEKPGGTVHFKTMETNRPHSKEIGHFLDSKGKLRNALKKAKLHSSRLRAQSVNASAATSPKGGR